MGSSLLAVNLGAGRAPVAVVAGFFHTCALLSGGAVACWGYNKYGQLGIEGTDNVGTSADQMGGALRAVDLGPGRTASVVDAGGYHTCVLLDGGDVACWGRNDMGQLGIGNTISVGTVSGQMGSALRATDLGSGRVVKALALGEAHSCALLTDGGVMCWGYNDVGQLGAGNRVQVGTDPRQMGSNMPRVDLGSGNSASILVAGSAHMCAVLQDGSVVCWGYNFNGQLGVGSTNNAGDQDNEMGVNLHNVDFGPGQPVLAMSAGGFHTCVLLREGAVVCWGYNGFGQLGIGSNFSRALPGGGAPQTVNLGSGVRAVSLGIGIYHTCVVRHDLRVVCWGRNHVGQLGTGSRANVGTSPDQMGDNLVIADLGPGVTVSAVAAGSEHTCALRSDGRVVCWGQNDVGQLGNGNTDILGIAPGQMGSKLRPVDLGTGYTAIALAVGGFHTCVLRSDKNVVCWGYNIAGQLGIGTTTNVGTSPQDMGSNLKPVQLGTGRSASSIFLGDGHTCTVRDDASLVCWGFNYYGQLGRGDKLDIGTSSQHMGDNLSPVDLGPGFLAVSGSSGTGHSCVVRNDSSLVCWGENSWGQLGIGSQIAVGKVSGQMGVNLQSVNIGPGRTVIVVALGKRHSCAIRSDMTVVCWGDDSDFQLGVQVQPSVGTDLDHLGDNLKPVDMISGSNPTAISAGGRHTCALLANGSVVCWGSNEFGQLGIGSINNVPGQDGSPLQAADLGPGLGAVTISAGENHNCAIRTDASVVCWGANLFGQLGIGSTANVGSSPFQMGKYLMAVDLGPGRFARSISAGYRFTCVIRDDGSVVCWGSNNYGQLGTGDTNDVGSKPGQTGLALKSVNLGTAAVSIACGADFSCSLQNNSKVVCWGTNAVGQLGIGSTRTVGLPAGDPLPSVDLGPGIEALALSIGGAHSCVLLRNKTEANHGIKVACWGYNFYGELGVGSVSTIGDELSEMGTSLQQVDIGSGREPSALALGGLHTCLLMRDTSVVCWGGNTYGQLGIGTSANVGVDPNQMGGSLKSAILGPGTVTSITAGTVHTCALRSGGEVVCWGSNQYGQLGIAIRTTVGTYRSDMGSHLLALDIGPGWCPQGSAFMPPDFCMCNVGSFEKGGRGEGACALCKAGSYSTSPGMSTCIDCSSGTFSTLTGATNSSECSFCWPGTFSSLSGGNSSKICTQCFAGTYANTPGANSSASCANCPPGSQSSSIGAINSSTCTSCLAGTYAPIGGSSVCTTCPVGTQSSRGAAFCSAGGGGLSVGAIVGAVVGAVAGLAIISFLVRVFFFKPKSIMEDLEGQLPRPGPAEGMSEECRTMYGMRCISVKGLEELIEKLRALPFFAGKDVDHISSNDVRKYILDGHDHPALLFPECFSEQEPVAAITYEWKLTFGDILSYLNAQQVAACSARWGGKIPLDMSQLLVWIDVFFIDQLSTNIAANLQEAMRIYSTAPFHLMLVTGSIFTRSWCLYEFAVRRHREEETLVLESLRVQSCKGQSSRCHFFEDMQATKEEDKQLIRQKIESAFGSGKRFDMEMLTLYLVAGGIRSLDGQS